VSIYKLFPGSNEDIGQKFNLLSLFMTLLKKLPDISDSMSFLELLVVRDEKFLVEGKELNLFEAYKKKVLGRDRVCESFLENLRQYFAHVAPPSGARDRKEREYVSQSAVNHYNFLVEMSYKYLEYLEKHKQYQNRCSKITSTMHNTIRSEIETLQREARETVTCIFSLLDDLITTEKDWPEFYVIYSKVTEHTAKDENLSDENLRELENLILSKDSQFLMRRFSLFDLEKRDIIMNFSFDKGSKFFDM
jgi:hypothetical protein